MTSAKGMNVFAPLPLLSGNVVSFRKLCGGVQWLLWINIIDIGSNNDRIYVAWFRWLTCLRFVVHQPLFAGKRNSFVPDTKTPQRGGLDLMKVVEDTLTSHG